MSKRKFLGGNRVHPINNTLLQCQNSDKDILSIVSGLRDFILANIDALHKNDFEVVSEFSSYVNETIKSINSSGHVMTILLIYKNAHQFEKSVI